MEKQVYFVTGIDTGCGKTHSTGLMARALRQAGVNVVTQKLVQTGCLGISEDILEHRRLMDCGLFPEDEAGITSPYVFSFPASPHLAAKLDNTVISIDTLAASTRKLSQKFDMVLVEGAGGLHVPLTSDILIIDYIKMLDYPVILVASSKLGSINHTLLSIESCFSRHIKLHALLYNRLPDNNPVITDDTLCIIKNALESRYPGTCLAENSNEDNPEALLKLFEKKT